MSGPIVLILDTGPGIGAHTATIFAQRGYSVVSTARSLTDKKVGEQHLLLHVDLAVPTDVRNVFRKVEECFGGPPSVVIHNGMV